ncbi:MAG TPA: cation:proton antiporter [Chitinophagaceae bacterium]
MAHLPNLILDLALIMAAAAITTLVFKWLKQPLVLGYIIAGFVVGPYFKWLPTVYELENIRIWAEIGVIFLLFSLGLEFSFKKLLKVGGSASITALVEVVVMVLIGYGVGKAMGWSAMDSLFLGGILSISSTTIIIRAFDELGLKSKQFSTLVFGVLIVEDLVAIVLMVLLSTLAVSQQFAGTEMLYSILKLVFFLFIWFAMGIFFIPSFLRKAKHLISDEMLLIIAVALCLMMVVFANTVGFSPALGAFIMGSILAETTKAEKIEHLVKPVRDLFGAIFFVSVGMLIDPAVLADYAIPITILCVVTIAGKILSTTLGAIVSGQPLQTAVQAGFSLAQIGEFSFIIATLGVTLNVTSDFLYPIAVAVSAVTTLTTPYLIKSSNAFAQWLQLRLPDKFTNSLNRYSSEARKATHTSEWKTFMRSTIINIVFLSGIIISTILLASRYVQPWIVQHGNSLAAKIGAAFITLVVLMPFLWALAIREPSESSKKIIAKSQYKGLINLIRLFKLCLAAFFIGFLLHRVFSLWTGISFTAIIIILLAIFSRRIQSFYSRLEKRFFANLNQREISAAKNNRTELAPWNAHIVPVIIPPGAPCIGKTLLELQWREFIGINVVMIKRLGHHIPVPAKQEMVFPGDELLVLGTDRQVQRLKVLIRPEEDAVPSEITDVELYEHVIPAGSALVGKTVRATGLREKANALVVGIERSDERILNPESAFVLAANDILFVVGNRKSIKNIFRQLEESLASTAAGTGNP